MTTDAQVEPELLFDGGECIYIGTAGLGFYTRCLNERLNLRLQDLRMRHGEVRVVERRIFAENGHLHSVMKVAA